MIRQLLAASLAVFLAVMSMSPGATAAEVKAVPVRSVTGNLTLDRAVEIALRQNPEVLKQLQEIERTRGQVIEIRAQALPQLTLNGAFDQQDHRLLERGSPQNGTFDLKPLFEALGIQGAAGDDSLLDHRGPSDKSYQVSLDLKQVIYAGGQVRAAISIARFTEDSAYFQLRDVVDSIISRTRQQFYTVLLTRALITVQEESIQLLSDQLKDQNNRFEAGTVPRFNVLQAEVALSNARPDLIRARNNYLIAELELAKTLGLDPGPGGKVTYSAVGTLGIPERPLNLSGALALARERRPFLKVQRLSILSQKEQIKVALAGYKPRLDAQASYIVRSPRLTDELDKAVDGWFYGITGSWNIFDGFATHGRVKQARAQLESAKINYDDSVQQVELEVQQAYANLQTARETIRSQQKNIEQALEALRLATERLAAGAGTQLDVLNARVQLTQARTTEIQSRADYNSFLAEFDRVTATDTIYDETFDDPLARRGKKAAMLKRIAVVEAKKAPAAKPDAKAARAPAKKR
jgi:outer membrane protein TolC